MNRTSLAICLAATMAATGRLLQQELREAADHAIDQQDQRAGRPYREEHQGIKDVDARAQAGIQP